MKKLAFIAVALFAAGTACGAHITMCDTLRGSKVYPGTVHTIQVTVPGQYDASAPANLYLGLDGILCNAPEVIDNLIGEGVLDPTVGVFLQPGVIYDADGEIVSYNRSNEFDATDSRFAEFLETEVLPRVESMTTPDGRKLRLSREPARRMIFGLSSGGIAAFTAAWHRPDLFGKVYTGCGTFVSMRGGNDLPALVRKTEPKPLRLFLQDGFQDAWNPLFGSWFEANALLASALEFAGYDMRTDWTNSGHSVTRTSEIFPQVMRWMFRDGAAPLAVPSSKNDMLADILVEGSGWTPCGMRCIPAGKKTKADAHVQALYPDGRHKATVRQNTNYLWKEILDKNGKTVVEQPFYWLHTYNNGIVSVPSMQFDSKGNLWVLTDNGIQVCDQNGRVRAMLPLPRGFEATCDARIEIGDGFVILSSPSLTVTRLFNVAPGITGQSPKSQGPA